VIRGSGMIAPEIGAGNDRGKIIRRDSGTCSDHAWTESTLRHDMALPSQKAAHVMIATKIILIAMADLLRYVGWTGRRSASSAR
jgi:hypothetical protein